MKIRNLRRTDVINNKDIKSNILSINQHSIKINCKVYKGDFFLDSFNYFPITKENSTLFYMFNWRRKSAYIHYYTESFNSKFTKDKNGFKVFNDILVIGSSPGDNYYRNLITFIPRIFFISNKQVTIAIHRKTSNKFREFIKQILDIRGIELKKFIFLDNDFYHFKNSLIPQFFPLKMSIKILNHFFKIDNTGRNRIYLTRKNAHYRKIINESDLIDILKSKNFQIIDLETLTINEQLNIFSSSEVIISATSSALANCVFCKKGTKVFEIMPKYKFGYENYFKSRYADICGILGCKYFSMEAEPVTNGKIDESTKQFVDKRILEQSNYYKNLIVKKENFRQFISKI